MTIKSYDDLYYQVITCVNQNLPVCITGNFLRQCSKQTYFIFFFFFVILLPLGVRIQSERVVTGR